MDDRAQKLSGPSDAEAAYVEAKAALTRKVYECRHRSDAKRNQCSSSTDGAPFDNIKWFLGASDEEIKAGLNGNRFAPNSIDAIMRELFESGMSVQDVSNAMAGNENQISDLVSRVQIFHVNEAKRICNKVDGLSFLAGIYIVCAVLRGLYWCCHPLLDHLLKITPDIIKLLVGVLLWVLVCGSIAFAKDCVTGELLPSRKKLFQERWGRSNFKRGNGNNLIGDSLKGAEEVFATEEKKVVVISPFWKRVTIVAVCLGTIIVIKLGDFEGCIHSDGVVDDSYGSHTGP